MKNLLNLIVLFAVLGLNQAFAQSTEPKPARIIGIAKDASNGEPVGYATAALYKKGADVSFAGAVADGDGKFYITGVEPGEYSLQLTFMGFETLTLESIQVNSPTGDTNLGELMMSDEGLALEEVTVQGQRELIEERVDRTIYKAENDRTTAGGDATDVLRRVPMLSVDLDGNVSMRGSSNITVLIDNRPSAIAASSITDALRQIPADEIKEVEVITSPSARFDAEGTSGVINIVTKKNNLQGMTLSINTGAGLRGSNLGLNGSARIGKFGFSLGGFGRAGYNVLGSFENEQQSFNSTTGEQSTVIQSADTERRDMFGRYNFGMDYEIDKYNFITGAVNFGMRNSKNWQTDFLTEKYTEGELDYSNLNETNSKNNGNSVDVSLNYTRTYEKKGKEISLLTLFTQDKQDNFSVNSLFNDDFQTIDYRLRNDNPSRNREFTVQLDFVNPLGEDGNQILEYGAKTILRKAYSDFAYFRGEGADGDFVELDDQTLNNEFSYDQNVTSGYGSYTFNFLKNYTLKTGLRYEYTTIQADFANVSDSEQAVDIPSYGTLVPSVNVSRKLKNGNMIKAAYNRRIQRPSMRFLNPNLDSLNNPTQPSQGNPSLDPELTDNFELGYSTFLGGTMINFTGFYRNTTGSIQAVRTVEPNGVIFTTYENIGQEQAVGTNMFTNININNKLSLNGGFDLYYSMLDDGLSTQNEGWVVSGRMFGNYSLPKDYQIQLFTFARGRRVQLQGSSGGFAAYGLSFNKQFKEKRGSIGIGAENFLFKEFTIKNETITPNIIQHSTNTMRNMNFKINFSYRIGKLSMNERQGRRRRSVSNDDLKGGEGGGEQGGMIQNNNK
ncbi:TonB-dependent receptor domain-containing protein [Algoriphagus vanfongensis]|uniref:TonB-dependent receptor domain-containing protein n=1 Tax=Algoriphagus vanfongensis TaxID=426371 RepID=UPI00041CC739|nr:TonB-dependent receptor [Algoriphagus vanfongensis]